MVQLTLIVELKNQILNILDDGERKVKENIEELRTMIKEMNKLNKQFKKKKENKSETFRYSRRRGNRQKKEIDQNCYYN